MKPIANMTDGELVHEIMSMNVRARVRAMFYHGYARIQQMEAQRKPPTALQVRRYEFEIAERIIALVQGKGTDTVLPPGPAPAARTRIRINRRTK
jgi:hypothetical protein